MKINIYILTGLMASCSIILGVIENFIPTPVPAIRLGLANVPIIIMLYLALAVGIVRVLRHEEAFPLLPVHAWKEPRLAFHV